MNSLSISQVSNIISSKLTKIIFKTYYNITKIQNQSVVVELYKVRKIIDLVQNGLHLGRKGGY